MADVEAVLFDYGLVLSGPPNPMAWEAMEGMLGVDEADFFTAYWKHRHDYDRSTLTGKTYWQAVARELHQSLSDEELTALLSIDVSLWTQPNTPMIEWAGRLQRAGLKTGILSNIGDAMEEGILAKAEWLGDFAHHTFSHRLGIAKPEAAIYQHAADGLGVRPEGILFIDDREENIVAAIQAGMQAIQYTDYEQFEADMRSRGLGYLLDI